MTALDTNILVRYLTQDDETQFRKVMRLLTQRQATFFVCDLVLAETDWVLRSLYDWSREEVVDAFTRLTSIPNLTFENEDRLRASLKGLRDGADLADEIILHACRDHGGTSFVTFDKGILKRHKPFAISP